MQKAQLNAKCERQRLLLQSYDFRVKHISGVSNNMLDYLSRSSVGPRTEGADDTSGVPTAPIPPLDTSTPCVNVVTTRSRARQQPSVSTQSSPSQPPGDPLPVLSPPLRLTPPSNAPQDLRIDFADDLDTLRLAQASDPDLEFIIDHISDPRFTKNYALTDGILMHFRSDSQPFLCVPTGKLRHDIMRIYHDTPVNTAHFDRDKTLRETR